MKLSEIRDGFNDLIEKYGDLECLDSENMSFGPSSGFEPTVEKFNSKHWSFIKEGEEYFVFHLN